ncbi:MAG: LL-diaminopimelate aminotransferase [Chitinispirillaceae bacterium]|jgi:LL-diaminopimelate aminotransferase|nr:LL-diaminopimelate aminotransferase [Chitinispirillaceae bacterium]
MIRINENYLKLKSSYLFSEIARRVTEFQLAHPDKEILRLGIGDVTLPLPPACIRALHAAVDEMADASTFRGYGPEQGYQFLRNAIAGHDFRKRGADISADEIFVSDGAKCDTGNIQELFAGDMTIAVPDPVYPVYVDTNVMAGRTGAFVDGRYQGLVYLDCTEKNGFVPALPEQPVDLIYLCFPNNPTGATATRAQLAQWVDYAKREKALILYDAAYAAFIRDESLPQSIFEIDGAREVAIEFRSFSKTAGFTGTRCAYTVVPKSCMIYDREGSSHELHALWNRRHTTKFNGVSYPVQRAAEACYQSDGAAQLREMSDYYMTNARLILKGMSDLGFACSGGVNAPYIWVNAKCDSWQFFDLLLSRAGVVCTPGAGFGRCGEDYIRLSAFNMRENVGKALKAIETALDP